MPRSLNVTGTQAGKAQGHGVEHVVMPLLFPFPVRRQIRFEPGISCGNRVRYFSFTGPTMACHGFLHRVGSEAHDGDAMAPAQDSDFIDKDIQKSGVAILPAEGLFDYQHHRSEVVDQSCDGSAALS